MNWITVLTKDLPQEAYVPRTLLEARGIPVHLENEIAVQTIAYLSAAVGGVSLQVPENRAEEARSILRKAGYLKPRVEGLNQWELQFRRLKAAIPGLNRLPYPWPNVILGAVLFLLTILLVAAITVGPDLVGQNADDADREKAYGYSAPPHASLQGL